MTDLTPYDSEALISSYLDNVAFKTTEGNSQTNILKLMENLDESDIRGELENNYKLTDAQFNEFTQSFDSFRSLQKLDKDALGEMFKNYNNNSDPQYSNLVSSINTTINAINVAKVEEDNYFVITDSDDCPITNVGRHANSDKAAEAAASNKKELVSALFTLNTNEAKGFLSKLNTLVGNDEVAISSVNGKPYAANEVSVDDTSRTLNSDQVGKMIESLEEFFPAKKQPNTKSPTQ